jgi:hypothetical protein
MDLSIIFDKIKNYLHFLQSSLREIIKGFLLFIFASLGLFSAVIFRSLDFNGVLITIISVIVELFGMLFCFLACRSYLEQMEEEIEIKPEKKKK